MIGLYFTLGTLGLIGGVIYWLVKTSEHNIECQVKLHEAEDTNDKYKKAEDIAGKPSGTVDDNINRL